MPNMAKYGNFGILGAYLEMPNIKSSGVSLRRSCKMQIRRIDLVSIRPPVKFLANFPNVITMQNFKVAAGIDLWVYNAENRFVGLSNITTLLVKGVRGKLKHRKNCDCCPGHYLSTSVY